MAKYQQYNEYKDSGVEWLGEIPKDWEMWKIAHAYLEIGSGTTPPSSNEEWYVGDIPWVTTGELREKLILDTKKKVSKKTIKAFPTLRIYPVGSIAIAMYGATIGRLGILGVEATTNQACCVMSQSNVIFNKFLYYWMQAFKDDIVRLSSGGGQPNINQETVASLKVSTPRHKEQVQIANFLDHETAQIDTLIEKQQTLIQLLKEKRQAVISHAVTKGLNPDSPMKDSGVEWLGEVPEHWDVKKIKHYGKIIGGFAFKSDDFIDSGYPVLKISNVSHLQLNFDDESFLPLSFVERHLEYKVEENDLVFAMTRPIISGGIKVAKIPKLKAMPLVNQRVGFLKLKSELLADFILYSSLSSSFKAQFKNNMTITNQPNISGEGIESVAFPIPPENELIKIVDFLNSSEGVFQNLSIKSEQQVELLKERRTALISAAVTGKIDVRGWVAPE